MTITRATLTPATDDTGKADKKAKALTVQFNPETLEVTARSKLQEEKGEKQDQTPVQVVGSTERSMSVQLIFDETTTGNDVRNKTSQIVAMMQAGDAVLKKYGKKKKDKKVKVPKLVTFDWGNFSFRGVIAECNETLEYFSADGVPLRASVKFSMQERNSTFAEETGDASDAPVDGGLALPPETPLPSGPDVDAAARKNGVENKRVPETDEIFPGTPGNAEEGGAVRGALGGFSESASWSSKNGAVNAFASAGSGMSPGGGGAGGLAGAGMGAGAGFGAGAGDGFGAGAGAGVSFGLPAAPIATGKAGLGAGFDLGAGLDLGFEAGAGASLSGGLDLSAGLDVSVGGELGLDAFAELKPPKLGAAGASLKSGMAELESLSDGFEAGASASSSAGPGEDGEMVFTARAEAGASVDLGALLFGENDP